MEAKDTAQKWTSTTNEVTIGVTSAEGGTRSKVVKVGGAKCLGWLPTDGDIGNRPAIAVEIWDSGTDGWPEALQAQYGDAMKNPVEWAKKAEEIGADLICLKQMASHPDFGDESPDDAAATVKAILEATGLPLIIWGCGVDEKENDVLPKCCQVAKGENCLMGTAREKNYRTIVASCLADGHKLIAESPLDINIAKQVNILAHDVGYPLENIVMWPQTAALGYGAEYVHSIMERGRLAGLSGDPLMQQPVLCDIGVEVWRAKEATAGEDILPGFGPVEKRGILWETITATNSMQAGAEILVMRHPEAIRATREAIDTLWGPA